MKLPSLSLRRPGPRGRPGLVLEALERRDCPAVQAVLRGDTLFVTGTLRADDAVIEDFGDGRVRVSSQGTAVAPDFGGARGIIVQTGDGDDTVAYKRASHPTASMDARFFLGAGDDQFSVLPGTDGGGASIAAEVTSRVSVETGAGGDLVIWAPELSAYVEQKVRTSFFADTGGGNDVVNAFPVFSAPPGSVLDCDVQIYTRAGADTVELKQAGATPRAPARVGTLDVTVDAGPNDDFVSAEYANLVADGIDTALSSAGGADQVSLAMTGVTVLQGTSVLMNTGTGADLLEIVTAADVDTRGDFSSKLLPGGGDDRAIIAIAGAVGGEAVLSFSGSDGNDSLDASAVRFQSSNVPQVLLNGDEGNDVIIGTWEPDILDGGPGNDYIAGAQGNDTIDGGKGSDTLAGADGNDLIHGGDGNDYVGAGPGDDTIDGGKGNDQLHGADGMDVVHGGDGADLITGADGNDMLYGDAGDDQIYGADGDDLLDGGGGLDYLYGGFGSDVLQGGGADLAVDKLVGGPGSDTFFETGEPWADLLIDFNPANGDSKI